jgi:glycyl-tRNA synthetase beta chain
LRVHLRDAFVRHDLIASVFARIHESDGDLRPLLARVDALRRFLELQDGANLLVAYRRAANIVAIEERRDARRYDQDPDPQKLEAPEERTLNTALGKVGGEVRELLIREQFEEAMAVLAKLRQPVDEFFERVTVNVDKRELRENRLRLLSRIRQTMNRVADFSQIEG